jgi:hypothetical protein
MEALDLAHLRYDVFRWFAPHVRWDRIFEAQSVHH